MSSCNTVCDQNFAYTPPDEQTITDTEAKSAADNILNAIGATACSTTEWTSTDPTITSSSTFVGLLGYMSSSYAETGGIETDSSSLGCEQIAVTAIQYAQTKKSIVQILNCSCTTINTSTIANNTIKITSYNSQWDCDLNISQNIDINVVSLNEITEQQKVDISSLTSTFLQNSVENLITSSSELGSTSDGQKTINDINTNITEETLINQATTTVNEMITSTSVGNQIEIELHDSLLTGEECNFDQNILLDITARNILSSSLSTLFENQSIQDAISEISTTQESEATGVATVIEKQGEVISSFFSALGLSNVVGILISLCSCCCVCFFIAIILKTKLG